GLVESQARARCRARSLDTTRGRQVTGGFPRFPTAFVLELGYEMNGRDDFRPSGRWGCLVSLVKVPKLLTESGASQAAPPEHGKYNPGRPHAALSQLDAHTPFPPDQQRSAGGVNFGACWRGPGVRTSCRAPAHAIVSIGTISAGGVRKMCEM